MPSGGLVGQDYSIDLTTEYLRSTRAYGALQTAKAVSAPLRSALRAALSRPGTGGQSPAGDFFFSLAARRQAHLNRDSVSLHEIDTPSSGLNAGEPSLQSGTAGRPITRTMDMPKMTERERLADLEARQRKVAEEVESARRALRDRYAGMVTDLPIEALSERDFRDVLTHAIRVGGSPAVSALKTLPAAAPEPKSRPKGGPATSMA
ncbi:hypothetical protein [Sphingobium terrigena]|nr:hypothetical protein [Sphingobium terrigena]